jgi:hypothetical protein
MLSRLSESKISKIIQILIQLNNSSVIINSTQVKNSTLQ